MITRTALQIVTDALKLIGVVAGHEVPTASEQTDAFARLNELIDSWGTHAQTMHVSRRALLALTAGQQTYPLAVPVPGPLGVDAVTVLATGATVEIPVAVLTTQEYLAIVDKSLQGSQVTGVVFSNSVPAPELWVWPVPTSAQTLALYYDQPVAQFPDLVTPVTLAPGYAKALRTNLAIELAPEFGRVVDPMVDRLARESLADVKRANVEVYELALSGVPGVCGGSYDILSDT
jgi:hypothetical protein